MRQFRPSSDPIVTRAGHGNIAGKGAQAGESAVQTTCRIQRKNWKFSPKGPRDKDEQGNL